MRSEFEEFLQLLQEDSSSEPDKGKRFEAIIRRALAQLRIYDSRFKQVQTFQNWARERGESELDTGIDLVAEREDGGFAAIQCKFYRRDATLNLNVVDRLISASDRPEFVERYLVWTGGKPTEPARQRIDQVEPRCQLIDHSHLASWGLNWREIYQDAQAKLRFLPSHTPRADQEEAIAAVLQKFTEHDRGKLILPCGTGKTATTLWLAERQVGAGGRVLYLVPSISLISQSMREWARHGRLEHRYIAVCSDRSVGLYEEDRRLSELDIPATTKTPAIIRQLDKNTQGKLTVVFSTYQSLEKIAEAQEMGAPAFDLVICDEAHRTTGVVGGERTHTPFTLVHDEERIRAKKRLFTTATPRIYREASKTRAREEDLILFSMDHEEDYGPEFYRMDFGTAIQKGLLSDYRVSILCINRKRTAMRLREIFSDLEEDGIDDLARLIGCWDALADPEGGLSTRQFSGAVGEHPCTTALAFTNTIKNSKQLKEIWETYIPRYQEYQEKEFNIKHDGLLTAEVEHVDGTDSAQVRQERLSWLEEISDDHHFDMRGSLKARILSNARCLTEGVDVPALDAILFTAPRRSTVDIVQAVGRVMRKAQKKRYGYIILPVVIDEGQSPEDALDDSAFETVWKVLSALRSHDNRLDAQVSLNIRQKLEDRIFILNGGADDAEDEDALPDAQQMPLELVDIPPGLIYAKIIEKVGDRNYLPRWASNVALIYERLRGRIQEAIEQEGVDAGFQEFIDELRHTINPSLRAPQAIDLLAQHMLTGPVFDAAFSQSGFAQRNPVARALGTMVDGLEERYGLEQETRELRGFYERVRDSFAGLGAAQRREAMQQLYEDFFRQALNKEATRLGVVYTPAPLVDFLLRSADWALQEHFGKNLADEGVAILDPFAGTGTFLARLMADEELLPDEALRRKYGTAKDGELHANEILLLAYYIAAVNLAQAYEERGLGRAPEFTGLVWTDTFQMAERELQEEAAGEKLKGLGGISAENDERILRQRDADITVIVGNPPYRAGQRSADDDNPNVKYPLLEKRIADTYAARSTTTLKRWLYDHYKLAIRYATDRLGEQGVIAFVSNASFIDGNTDGGLRACWQDEFAKAYIFHLRGAALQGRAEGQNVFDIRQPVALMLLVKDACHDGTCTIHYVEMPDYLKRQEKFDLLGRWQHFGAAQTKQIIPDRDNNWINQSDPEFNYFIAIGDKATKAEKDETAIFRTYAHGFKSGRDVWVYNSSYESLEFNVHKMISFYEKQRLALKTRKKYITEVIKPSQQNIKWDSALIEKIKRDISAIYDENQFSLAQLRPFYSQYIYCNRHFTSRPGITFHLAPPPAAPLPPRLQVSKSPSLLRAA